MSKTREELIEQYIKDTVKFYPDQERVRQYSNSLGLNPYLDEIVYTPRWNSKRNCYTRGSLIIPFDIILAKAWDTGLFLGVDTEEVYDKKTLICVKAVGKRNVNGQIATISFNAYMDEYRPETRSEYSPWTNMPTVMLRKCAIANVVRQLFSDSLKLPYIAEEIEQSQVNRDNTKPPVPIEVPKGEHQKVTEKVTEKVTDQVTNEQKAQESLKWVEEYYYIVIEKGEDSLTNNQLGLIKKAIDKNLPNVKNSTTKDMLLSLSIYYSTVGGVKNPLEDYPDDMFNDVENPFNEEKFEESEFPTQEV